ncbi:hypothetical protein EST38_g9764 [Candolleomyces aberdarensis]|uniref:Uncharacterized protein n=1 Tax=Candolleomyces aberdarensis TaxID=2316362 RepID=A0A4Q2DBG7_9AGAR|nr:hypothetical protein EST38_g9764 [Candolleomyces aberdarensis]
MPEASLEDEVDPDDTVPIVSLDDLKLTLKFVEHVRNAELKGSGLSNDTIRRLRAPVQSLLDLEEDPDLELCINLYITLGRTSQKDFNEAMNHLSVRFPDSKFLTYEACRKKVEELSGVVSLLHDMCINTCMAYTGPLLALNHCRHCGEPRYDSSKRKPTPRQQFYTIPLGPQLQGLLQSLETAKLVRYQHEETERTINEYSVESEAGTQSIEPPVISDYIHGQDYLKAVISGDLQPDDLVLMLSIDGAQLYEHKASDCWIYIWVLMDLPPDMQ